MPRVLASAVRARDPESLDRRHLIQEAELLAVRVDPCPELPAMALDEREAVAGVDRRRQATRDTDPVRRGTGGLR